MAQSDFEKNWPSYRERLRKAYPELTVEELRYEAEREHELWERIQKRTGKTKAEIYNWLHLWGSLNNHSY